MQETILVTGANGQLGSELRLLAPSFPGYHFVFTDRESLPLDDRQTIDAVFDRVKPDWCIHCAAYTTVDKAESEKELANLINGTAVGWIAAAAARSSARLIHISTDYVFDGKSETPLREDDRVSPVNAYGVSKLLGERLALENNTQTLIIRTSWVYSEFGNNFVKTMIRLMRERPKIGVVNDQIGSPTYAADLAGAILSIMGRREFVPGIYHYSNEGETSWYGFALAIKQRTGSSCEVQPLTTAQYPTPAKRPHFSLLDKTKIRKVYGIEIPDWQDSLGICIKRLNTV